MARQRLKGEKLRLKLCDDCTELMLHLTEFQGPGVIKLMEFISQIIGDTNYTHANTNKLKKLLIALEKKLVLQFINQLPSKSKSY